MANVPVQAQQLLSAPVSGPVTSRFGWRSDPMGAGSRFHAGVDIAASKGTPVYAPQNAYVAYSGLYRGYGNVVVLDHGYGLYTLYGHASALYVKAGQAVARGQAIAAVGSTGRSTGPHLHFEVHQNGQYVDPIVYLSYVSKNGFQTANPVQVASKASTSSVQPIQVTVAQNSPQANPLSVTGQEPDGEVSTDSIPPQVLLAQAGASQPVGKPSQVVTLSVQKPAIKSGSSNRPAVKNIASRTGKRVGKYLASGAVQIVSGKRVNWVRF